MRQYGAGGIPGISAQSCEALCEATSDLQLDGKASDACRAIAFKRNSRSVGATLGWCYLLNSAGACSLDDFATTLYTRQIESERACFSSSLENPLCVWLPSTRDDSRILTHQDAAAAAAEVPYANNPAPGSGGLPLPRSVVESMAMIAYARQEGVVAFWARSPNTEAGPATMHWITPDGKNLVYQKDETRCILISSGTGPNSNMFAHLRPCDSKQASGLLTVAAAAVRCGW